MTTVVLKRPKSTPTVVVSSTPEPKPKIDDKVQKVAKPGILRQLTTTVISMMPTMGTRTVTAAEPDARKAIEELIEGFSKLDKLPKREELSKHPLYKQLYHIVKRIMVAKDNKFYGELCTLANQKMKGGIPYDTNIDLASITLSGMIQHHSTNFGPIISLGLDSLNEPYAQHLQALLYHAIMHIYLQESASQCRDEFDRTGAIEETMQAWDAIDSGLYLVDHMVNYQNPYIADYLNLPDSKAFADLCTNSMLRFAFGTPEEIREKIDVVGFKLHAIALNDFRFGKSEISKGIEFKRWMEGFKTLEGGRQKELLPEAKKWVKSIQALAFAYTTLSGKELGFDAAKEIVFSKPMDVAPVITGEEPAYPTLDVEEPTTPVEIDKERDFVDAPAPLKPLPKQESPKAADTPPEPRDLLNVKMPEGYRAWPSLQKLEVFSRIVNKKMSGADWDVYYGFKADHMRQGQQLLRQSMQIQPLDESLAAHRTYLKEKVVGEVTDMDKARAFFEGAKTAPSFQVGAFYKTLYDTAVSEGIVIPEWDKQWAEYHTFDDLGRFKKALSTHLNSIY